MRAKYVKLLIGFLLSWSFNTQAQIITEAEYFWDTDLGVGSGISIDVADGQDITSNATISTLGLNSGLHTLYIRVKDEDDVWSHYNGILVIVQQDGFFTEVVGGEYFWDEDPGIGNGTPISFDQGTSVAGQIAVTPAILPGIHYLHMRVKDANHVWSHYDRMLVIVENNSIKELIQMEYFWDMDPGVGNGTSVDIADAIEFDGNVPVSTVGLPLGNHNLYIRVQDETLAWSHYKMVTFSVCETFGAVSAISTDMNGSNTLASYSGDFATSFEWTLDGVFLSSEESVEVPQTVTQELCLIATNGCGADTSCVLIGMPQLISVNPNVVPNNLTQVLELTGIGFSSGSTVKIVKDTEQINATLTAYNSASSLTATFDFSMETIGLWDVVVIQDDNSELTLTEGLELTMWIGLNELGSGNFIGDAFPNPVTNGMHLPYSFTRSEMLTISVYNTVGKLLHQQSRNVSGNGALFVDMIEYSAGMYVVDITCASGNKSIRIIKD
jgi:hypothetical protein